MTNRPALEVRPATSREEVLEFQPILTYSLFFPPLEEFDWLKQEGIANFRLARLVPAKKRGRDRVGELVGGLSIQRMGQWFGGRSVGTAAVRCVAVAPSRRSLGVARALLAAHFEEMRAEGIPLSTLYPSTQRFYRMAGYERAGTRSQWRVPTTAFDVRMPDGIEMRPTVESDEPSLRALDAARALRSNGMLHRSDWMWRRIVRPLGAKNALMQTILERGRPAGWVSASVERIPTGLAAGVLRLHDIHGNSRAALQAAMAYLAGHRSVVPEVILWAGPSDPLWLMMANQDSRPESIIHWMLRLVDAAAAFAARGYPALIAKTEIHLNISDPVCAWNHGRKVLRVADGRGELRPGGRGAVTADIRALASLYSSLSSPFELAAAGLLSGPDADLERLAQLFAGPAPWMPDMF